MNRTQYGTSYLQTGNDTSNSSYAGGSNLTTTVQLMSPSLQRGNAYPMVKTARNLDQCAMFEAAHEQHRVIMAKHALENTAALSALEEHLCHVSPFGEERYSFLNDVFTISTAQRIARW